MGGCRNRSDPIPFVPRSPSVIGAAVTAPIPFAVNIDLEFSEAMNTTLTPGDVNVELVADAVPTWLTFVSWTDATHARYAAAVVWPPLAATVQLKVHDTQLQNLVGGDCFTSGAFVIVP